MTSDRIEPPSNSAMPCPACGHTIAVHHPERGCGLCACGPPSVTEQRATVVVAANKWAQAAWWGPTSDVLHQAENDLLSAVMGLTAALMAASEESADG